MRSTVVVQTGNLEGNRSSRSATRPMVADVGVEIEALSIPAGPVPDRMAIWPIDDGRYGLDATFQGQTGYERADWHVQALRRAGAASTLRQELDGGWTVRLGPLRAVDVAAALSAFVR